MEWTKLADTKLYLIEILHQTTTRNNNQKQFRSCILSKFYIKPQRRNAPVLLVCCCILSKFYIKPQLAFDFNLFSSRCILSKFYIKPQRKGYDPKTDTVVSYRNSTSNHNYGYSTRYEIGVVSYRNSTSNHNSLVMRRKARIVVSYRNSTSNHNVGPHID